MTEALVHAKNFRWGFGDTTVVEDSSLDVHMGESSGVLDFHQWGNSTTLRALLGSINPPL